LSNRMSRASPARRCKNAAYVGSSQVGAEVGDEGRYEDQVDRAVADHLVGDAHPRPARVAHRFGGWTRGGERPQDGVVHGAVRADGSDSQDVRERRATALGTRGTPHPCRRGGGGRTSPPERPARWSARRKGRPRRHGPRR
jgi:hypothetical protein